jgi:S1-C subfamily serine protease
MNELSKQQLILLALLVSFVTSLATGIVTVSLMDQAPQGVTQTITQVITKTIQSAAPTESTAKVPVVANEDETTNAVSTVTLGIVKIRGRNSNELAGMGLVMSKSGVILANKATVAPLMDYVAVLPEGIEVPVSIIQSQIEGDIVFLAPSATTQAQFTPVGLVSPQLGQVVYSLSGTSSPELGQGLITRLPEASSTSGIFSPIKTSIAGANILPGSALFNIKGQVIGIRTSSANSASGAEYYPIKELAGVIPSAK